MQGFNPTPQCEFKEAGCRWRQGSSEKDANDQRITEGMFIGPLVTRTFDPWDPLHSDSFRVEQETPRYFLLR
jgi:hypothetical protein